MNFWSALPRPFTLLAPMEDVTDTVFRQMVASLGGPEVYFTEFVRARDLLVPKNKFAAAHVRFEQPELTKPLVVQLWGSEPEKFHRAALELKGRGFSGIDINMGCPQPRVVRGGNGAALIRNPQLAKELVQAVREGAGGLPVSVKTRLGYSRPAVEDWIGFLLEMDLPALTVHGRVQAQAYTGKADWEEIARVVQLRDRMGKETAVIGNGDIFSGEDFRRRWEQSGVDGLMVGRGILKDPALFRAWPTGPRQGYPAWVPFDRWPVEEKLGLLVRHLDSHERIWAGEKGYGILKKFFRTYIADFAGHEALRLELMKSRSPDESREVIKAWKTGEKTTNSAIFQGFSGFF